MCFCRARIEACFIVAVALCVVTSVLILAIYANDNFRSISTILVQGDPARGSCLKLHARVRAFQSELAIIRFSSESDTRARAIKSDVNRKLR